MHEKAFVGGSAHPNERRAVARANPVRKSCLALTCLKGAVRRRWCGKEKEWTDCVQSDVRTFGIARTGKYSDGVGGRGKG